MKPKATTRLALFILFVLFALAGTAQAATINVPPGGNLSTAYNSAASGDTIQLQAGRYGQWSVPSGTKTITVKGVPGTKLLQIKTSSSNMTFDGLDLDAEGTKTTGAVFDLGETFNVTLRNSRVGNVVDEKGAMLGGADTSTAKHNVVIDNVAFHDVRQVGAGVHNECIMSHTPGVTIRNSTFTNCATFDISLGRGDWYGQPVYGNVTIENNVFGHSTNGGSGWHYYGLAWWLEKMENARVVGNTFENAVMFDSSRYPTPRSGVWANNIGGGWDCLAGIAYAGNVGKACSAADKAVSPSSSCGPPACASLVTMPVGWTSDWHLTAGSPAIDAGSATYASATDREGKARVGAPDAGAYEFGGSTTPPPAAVCNDGIDNDGDGKIDFPADLGCSSTTDDTEAPDPTAAYHPACEPTCDAQIATLTGERNTARSDLAVMTADRDAWRSRAQKAEDQVARIRAITGE